MKFSHVIIPVPVLSLSTQLQSSIISKSVFNRLLLLVAWNVKSSSDEQGASSASSKDTPTELPFQLQLTYMDLDGTKAMRVLTQLQPVTTDRKEAQDRTSACCDSVVLEPCGFVTGVKVKRHNTYTYSAISGNCSFHSAVRHRLGRTCSLQAVAHARASLAAKHLHTVPARRLMVATFVIHVITWVTTHLPTPKGWKAELAWLVDPQRTPYPRSGHMSAIDQVQIRKSSPVYNK